MRFILNTQQLHVVFSLWLPSVYRLLSNCHQKAYILENHSDRDGVQSENRGVHDVHRGRQFVIIHTYRICMPSECNISFATRDLSSGDIVNDHLAYTCRNVLIENCESFKYLRSNDVNA